MMYQSSIPRRANEAHRRWSPKILGVLSTVALPRRARCWLGWILGMILLTTSAPDVQADVVWLKDSAEPRYGRVIGVDERQLTFDVRNEAGEYERKTFAMDSVADWVITVDVARLERLDPGRPDMYRDYGEELVTARADPEAQALAVRLLTIAAYQADRAGNRDLRDSAIRNLAAAARSDAERTMVERLGQAYGLTLRPPVRGWPPSISPAAARPIALLVKVVRLEQWKPAVSLLTQRSIQRSWERADFPLSWDDLVRLVNDQTLPASALETLVWIELAVDGAPPPAQGRENDAPWSSQAIQDDVRDRLVPDLRHWSSIDPERSVYRGGQWVVPPKR